MSTPRYPSAVLYEYDQFINDLVARKNMYNYYVDKQKNASYTERYESDIFSLDLLIRIVRFIRDEQRYPKIGCAFKPEVRLKIIEELTATTSALKRDIACYKFLCNSEIEYTFIYAQLSEKIQAKSAVLKALLDLIKII